MTIPNQLPPEILFQINFNVHMVPAAIGLDVSNAAMAAMLNISEEQLVNHLKQVDETNRDTVKRLLSDEVLAEVVTDWDVPVGGKVLMIGDSITTYRYGYARLLAAMLDLRRPGDHIQVINAAQSGYTSTHGLEATYTQQLAYQPDWVFIKYGVNDCKQFGGSQADTLVSIADYERNMRMIVTAFQRYTAAHITLITPAPIVESIANNLPDFVTMRMTWDNKNIEACADVIRKLGAELGSKVVDFVKLFGPEPEPAYFLPDGLHPGPLGHRLMVQELLRSL